MTSKLDLTVVRVTAARCVCTISAVWHTEGACNARSGGDGDELDLADNLEKQREIVRQSKQWFMMFQDQPLRSVLNSLMVLCLVRLPWFYTLESEELPCEITA